jgi:NCAIR mutase (PurE)-related protein
MGEFVPLWHEPIVGYLFKPLNSSTDRILGCAREPIRPRRPPAGRTRRTASPADARARLAGYATEDLGFATIDHAREARTGWPEVVFGAGKTPEQVAAIAERIAARGHNVLVTRTTAEAFRLVSARLPRAIHQENARCITVEVSRWRPWPAGGRGVRRHVGPAVAEAAITASFQGASVARSRRRRRGIHRLLGRRTLRDRCDRGRGDGGRPALRGGRLVAAPVVAVPTSVGYGASFEGLAASGHAEPRAAGLAVVNIDNGFAGHLACTILRSAARLTRDAENLTKVLMVLILWQSCPGARVLSWVIRRGGGQDSCPRNLRSQSGRLTRPGVGRVVPEA